MLCYKPYLFWTEWLLGGRAEWILESLLPNRRLAVTRFIIVYTMVVSLLTHMLEPAAH